MDDQHSRMCGQVGLGGVPMTLTTKIIAMAMIMMITTLTTIVTSGELMADI